MLADLWRAPEPCEVAGCATVGSSEGVMMGGLALKRRWERRRKEAGLPYDKPNVIFGENAHVRVLYTSALAIYHCLHRGGNRRRSRHSRILATIVVRRS